MYIPIAYRIEDQAKICAFIHAHGFASLVTHDGTSPSVSHLPVLLDHTSDGDTLRGHMARANEQWQHFASGQEVLCIFHGPHAYISPSWYTSKIAVPTWNYATVHVYGKAKVETDPTFVRRVLDDTTSKYESHRKNPWKINFPEDTVSSLMKAVVGFSIQITRVEGKFKLSQNRSIEDQEAMLSALEQSSDVDSRSLAIFIKSQKEDGTN
jgi:transcriptional regulator